MVILSSQPTLYDPQFTRYTCHFVIISPPTPKKNNNKENNAWYTYLRLPIINQALQSFRGVNQLFTTSSFQDEDNMHYLAMLCN